MASINKINAVKNRIEKSFKQKYGLYPPEQFTKEVYYLHAEHGYTLKAAFDRAIVQATIGHYEEVE